MSVLPVEVSSQFAAHSNDSNDYKVFPFLYFHSS